MQRIIGALRTFSRLIQTYPFPEWTLRLKRRHVFCYAIAVSGLEMETSVNTSYAHRFNLDGTIDSICRQCFMTVAKARREADLEAYEREHLCYSEYIESRSDEKSPPSG